MCFKQLIIILTVGLIVGLGWQHALAQTATLPDDIKWLTNEKDPIFASLEAVKGGMLKDAILSFPLTFRTVGPDSNSSL